MAVVPTTTRQRNAGPPLEYMESFKNAEGRYQCVKCDKSYFHFKHLKRHYMKHTGNRPHVCRICQDTFCRSDILKRHYARCLAKFQVTGRCAAVSRVPKQLVPQSPLYHNYHTQQHPQQRQPPQFYPPPPLAPEAQQQQGPLSMPRYSPHSATQSMPSTTVSPASHLSPSPLPSPTGSAYPARQPTPPHYYHPPLPQFYPLRANGGGLGIYHPHGDMSAEKHGSNTAGPGAAVTASYSNVYPASPRDVNACGSEVLDDPAARSVMAAATAAAAAAASAGGVPVYGSFYHNSVGSTIVGVPSPASTIASSPCEGAEKAHAHHQQPFHPHHPHHQHQPQQQAQQQQPQHYGAGAMQEYHY